MEAVRGKVVREMEPCWGLLEAACEPTTGAADEAALARGWVVGLGGRLALEAVGGDVDDWRANLFGEDRGGFKP
jgi:hypothetical protein